MLGATFQDLTSRCLQLSCSSSTLAQHRSLLFRSCTLLKWLNSGIYSRHFFPPRSRLSCNINIQLFNLHSLPSLPATLFHLPATLPSEFAIDQVVHNIFHLPIPPATFTFRTCSNGVSGHLARHAPPARARTKSLSPRPRKSAEASCAHLLLLLRKLPCSRELCRRLPPRPRPPKNLKASCAHLLQLL